MENATVPLISIIILVFQGVVTFIVSIIAWGVKGIFSQLREMNGNVRDLKAWKEMHQPQEEQWHEEDRQSRKDIWSELKSLREK